MAPPRRRAYTDTFPAVRELAWTNS